MKYALGSTVGERGQITIAKEIREKLGVSPRDVAIQHVEDGRLVVTFVKHFSPHTRSVAGILGPPPRLPEQGKSWDEILEDAAAAEYASKEPSAIGDSNDDA